MEWIHQNQEFIILLAKILAAVISAGLFVRFTYRFTVKYFESMMKDIVRMKSFIWGADGHPRDGMADRLARLEQAHEDRVCSIDKKEKRKKG